MRPGSGGGAASGTAPGAQAASLRSRSACTCASSRGCLPPPGQGWAFRLGFLHRLPPSPGVLPLLPPGSPSPLPPCLSQKRCLVLAIG